MVTTTSGCFNDQFYLADTWREHAVNLWKELSKKKTECMISLELVAGFRCYPSVIGI